MAVAEDRREEEYDEYPDPSDDGYWEEWEEAIVNAALGL